MRSLLFVWQAFWDGAVFGMNFSLDRSRDVVVSKTLQINNVWAAQFADFIEMRCRKSAVEKPFLFFFGTLGTQLFKSASEIWARSSDVKTLLRQLKPGPEIMYYYLYGLD